MKIQKKCAVIMAASMSIMVGAAKATTIPVANYSFESPDLGSPGLAVPEVDDWTTTTTWPPAEGYTNPYVGVFSNLLADDPAAGEWRIQNADQNQLVYIFSNSTNTLSQVLTTATFQPGQQYNLTVGVANAGSAPATGDTLAIQLYYTTAADPNTPVILATRNVVEGTDSLNQTELTDFTASTAGLLAEDDPAVGNQIGIIFTTTGSGAGEFDLDNVRLSTSVPEPGVLGILAGTPLLVLRRRRRTVG